MHRPTPAPLTIAFVILINCLAVSDLATCAALWLVLVSPLRSSASLVMIGGDNFPDARCKDGSKAFKDSARASRGPSGIEKERTRNAEMLSQQLPLTALGYGAILVGI